MKRSLVGERIGVLGLARSGRAAARLIGFRLQAQFTRGRPQEVQLANCSAQKARRLLGYRPRVRLAIRLRRPRPPLGTR